MIRLKALRTIRFIGLVILITMFFPNICQAAVTIPWSTSYNEVCDDEWEWSGVTYNPPCYPVYDRAGDYTCSGGEGEQITTAANMAAGAGGRGQRHWEGDGTNNNSGGIRVQFTAQSELWIRWYMRYELGFAWSSLNYDKILYMHTDGAPDCIPEFKNTNDLLLAPQDTGGPYDYYAYDEGWTTIMGGATSDGEWHCHEIHLKMDTDGTDGVGEWWVDGVLVMQHTDCNWGGTVGSTTGWNYVGIGANQATPDNGRCMAVDFDDIAISATGYIGPLSADPEITVVATDGSADEDGGTGTYTISCSPNCSSTSIDFTMSGTATEDTDYTLSDSDSITITGASDTITLTPIDDLETEVNETATITIDAGSGYTVGSPETDDIAIADNDRGIFGCTISGGAKVQ